MWTYNVCRKLIVAAGKTPWPDAVPLDEAPVIKQALSRTPEQNQVYCIKTHFQIPVGKPHMRIICNYRDVRDAMLSYMRFMKCSFEKGIAVARGSMAITDHYLRQPHPHVFPVRYDAVVAHPQETIRTLAGFLSLSVPDPAIEAIAQALSREEVRRHLETIGSHGLNPDETARGGDKPHDYSIVQNLDGSFRAHDPATGFQTDHISSNKDGEWREVLSPSEQSELMNATGEWLARYHFDL